MLVTLAYNEGSDSGLLIGDTAEFSRIARHGLYRALSRIRRRQRRSIHLNASNPCCVQALQSRCIWPMSTVRGAF